MQFKIDPDLYYYFSLLITIYYSSDVVFGVATWEGSEGFAGSTQFKNLITEITK